MKFKKFLNEIYSDQEIVDKIGEPLVKNCSQALREINKGKDFVKSYSNKNVFSLNKGEKQFEALFKCDKYYLLSVDTKPQIQQIARFA